MARRNRLNVNWAKQMMRDAYGLRVEVLNGYQFRLTHEESGNVVYNWYHTTGSLVRSEKYPNCQYSSHRNMGRKIIDPEEVAIFIKDDIYS